MYPLRFELIVALLLSMLAGGVSCTVPDDGDAKKGKKVNRARDRKRTLAQKRKVRALKSLPYTNWVPVRKQDRKASGVMQHNPGKAYQGVNFYNSLPRSAAHLLDMNGKILHTWSSDAGQPTAAQMKYAELWPPLNYSGWHHVHLTPAGDMFVILYYEAILKLSWDSKVVWRADIRAHHDMDVAANGNIYTVVGKRIPVTHNKNKMFNLDHLVVVLSPNGKEKKRFSLIDVLRKDRKLSAAVDAKLSESLPHFGNSFVGYYMGARFLRPKHIGGLAKMIKQILDNRFAGGKRVEYTVMSAIPPMDILHCNSIQILDRKIPGLGQKGDLLLSMRDMDLLVVVDPRREKVRWSWGPGELDRQHHPSIMENGHVMVFDNGYRARRSRILEIDPKAKKIVWSHVGKPPSAFYSGIRGSAQQLPNQNVLITDSERGRAFEVTRAGEIVWEFFNPDLKDPYINRLRAPIYRMMRFPKKVFQGRLKPGARR